MFIDFCHVRLAADSISFFNIECVAGLDCLTGAIFAQQRIAYHYVKLNVFPREVWQIFSFFITLNPRVEGYCNI